MASVPAMAKSAFKVGDEVYVCGCDDCPCLEMAHKGGKCVCGKAMVKSRIDKISKGKATVMVNVKAQMFPVNGKFICPSGNACDCDAVSQKPGYCPCPCKNPMKEVEPKAKK